jgi:hypothetical protein
MREMTDQEAEFWDDYYTKNTIMPDPDKPGYFARKGLVLGSLDDSSRLDPDVTEYLRTQATATGQTQAQIASTIIREKFAKGA